MGILEGRISTRKKILVGKEIFNLRSVIKYQREHINLPIKDSFSTLM